MKRLIVLAFLTSGIATSVFAADAPRYANPGPVDFTKPFITDPVDTRRVRALENISIQVAPRGNICTADAAKSGKPACDTGSLPIDPRGPRATTREPAPEVPVQAKP